MNTYFALFLITGTLFLPACGKHLPINSNNPGVGSETPALTGGSDTDEEPCDQAVLPGEPGGKQCQA